MKKTKKSSVKLGTVREAADRPREVGKTVVAEGVSITRDLFRGLLTGCGAQQMRRDCSRAFLTLLARAFPLRRVVCVCVFVGG